ncbi:unnamed protein product [Leptosia nina]|uniref:Uncharacterized protein n=1 Tax=Leptosia nina TaxID=320188 RepID=A0AAV1JC06_9NEOP
MSGSVDADKYSVAYVTVPSTDVGKTIGHGLVKNKLAACVNIIPQVTSIYEWKHEINEDNEALLMIKTRTSLVDQLTEFVRTNHPYERSKRDDLGKEDKRGSRSAGQYERAVAGAQARIDRAPSSDSAPTRHSASPLDAVSRAG